MFTHYYPNQIVLTHDGLVGRVIHHNWYTHSVEVLIRMGDNFWQAKRYDDLNVQLTEGFMWGMEVPFHSKFVSGIQFYKY